MLTSGAIRETAVALESLGWTVATEGDILTSGIGAVFPAPVFRAWGHPRCSRERSLYGVAHPHDPHLAAVLRGYWKAGAKSLWLVGAEPGLALWGTLGGALQGMPAGCEVFCARPHEIRQGVALAITSRAPEWMEIRAN